MQLVLDTIEGVGPDRTKVTDALGRVQNHDSIVGPVTFDDYGQNTVPLTPNTWRRTENGCSGKTSNTRRASAN